MEVEAVWRLCQGYPGFVEENSWCGRKFLVWKKILGVEENSWCGRKFLVWKKIPGAARED
ncbi:hypothetical protein [Bartonella sp. CB175]|uniref:hypothetical protein n=1 Tax=Bartonella sp. CB175 TaxID=3112256 RepID=UPI00300E0102